MQDLWALRLQLLNDKTAEAPDDETLFSSQPVSEAEKDGEDDGRKWTIKGKAMPTLIETLALVYLGTVLLHLPVGIGDVHRYRSHDS